MKSSVSELLNKQINFEFFSAYLYLDIANYYDEIGLDGFANYFEVQAKEEQDHAMLMYKYMRNNDEKVIFESIRKPETNFKDMNEPLEVVLNHEKGITNSINKLYKEAQEDNDFRTLQFLDWFVKEQGEEEKNASDMITKMKLYGTDAKGLYMLNSELLARTYQAPTLTL